MNKINSVAGRSLFKLAIPLLFALGCAPVPVLAATFTPYLDSAEGFGARDDTSAASILTMGTGLMTASTTVVTAQSRNASSGVFRQLGSSATLGARTLFARNIIASQSITLDTTTSSLCGSAASGDCVASYVSKDFAAAALTAVPVPAALWLFASGLIGVIGMVRRRPSVAA